MSQEEGDLATKKKSKVKKPRLFKVIFLNDDYTTMEFVVAVLEVVFRKSPAEAAAVMLNVHNNGAGIAGVYTKEIAETKIEKQQRGLDKKGTRWRSRWSRSKHTVIQKDLEVAIYTAFREAEKRRHEYVTLEHLLYVLCFDKTTRIIMKRVGLNVDKLKSSLDKFLQETIEALPEGTVVDPQQTAGFQRVMQRAIFHVQSSGADEVTGGNVLVAIFNERDSHAVFFLEEQGVTRLDVVSFISHGMSFNDGENSDSWSEDDDDGFAFSEDDDGDVKGDPLEAFCSDLVDRAMNGHIDPLIGRDPEIERTIQILCRRRKNNPIWSANLASEKLQ